MVASMADIANQVPRHEVKGHQECAGCHSVHGGSHAQLLRGVAEKVPMGVYDAANFSLCFSCHDQALASDPLATEFRDGDLVASGSQVLRCSYGVWVEAGSVIDDRSP